MRPLNGEKTHALSEYAMLKLREIAVRPCPRSALNPGVVNRLLMDNLVTLIVMRSPFKTHHGKEIDHLRITEEGKRLIMEAKS